MQKGKLILREIPTKDIEQRVVSYLSRFFKDASPEFLAVKLRNTPLVLSKNITAENGLKIADALQKLGASAVFVSHAVEGASGQQEPSIKPTDTPAVVNSQPHPEISQPHILTAKHGRRKWGRHAFSLILLSVLLSVLAWQLYPMFSYKPSIASIPRIDFTAYRPYTKMEPMIKKVAPQDMYQAFLYQYRLRPDTRFIAAFRILVENFNKYLGNPQNQTIYKIGEILSNGKEILMPLIKRDNVIAEIRIPLPMTFSNGMSAFNELLNAMNQGKTFSKTNDIGNDFVEKLEAAKIDINMVDPLAIIDGLTKLEALWRQVGPTPKILQASARAYAMLHTILCPDKMNYNDEFAAHALSLLALAKWIDPDLSLANEEAFLAMNMDYTAHSTALVQSCTEESIDPVNKIFDAYIRQDLQGLARLKGKVPELLRAYILARVYRDMQLYKEAEKVVTELLEHYPASYPTIVEMILSGDLNVAKILTVLYPLDILTRLEHVITPDSSTDVRTWQERIKGFEGEKSASNISMTQFEALLNNWRPLPDEAQGLLVDENRVKTIFRTLYSDALHLRFNVLFNRWAVVDKAKNYTELLASKDKGHPLVMNMLAKVYAELGRHEETEAICAGMIKQQDTPGGLAVSAFFTVNDIVSQIGLTPAVANKMDGRPECLLSMGTILHRQRNYDLAEKYYSLGLTRNPHWYKGYKYLAQVTGSNEPMSAASMKFPFSFNLMEEAGDYFLERHEIVSKGKALVCYDQALKLVPQGTEIPQKKAKVLRELNRHDEAIHVLKTWIEECGQNDLITIFYKSSLANTYLEIGNPSLALEVMKDQIGSYQAGAMMVGAKAYEKMGLIRQAEEIYRAALNRYPTVDHVLSGTALFLWEQGKNKEAAQVIALGRKRMGRFSRWYFEDFLKAFEQAPDEQIMEAIDSLIEHGASDREINNLGLCFHRRNRSEIAFKIIRKAPARQTMERMEQCVNLYMVLRKWKGEESALEYLNKAIPPQNRLQMSMVLYNKGIFDVILTDFNDPGSCAPSEREFMWLQRLIAWLALEKNPANLEKELIRHYKYNWHKRFIPNSFKAFSNDYYHDIGRYLLGMISHDEFLDMVKTQKQRCEFAYYIGLYERLKDNFTEATNWYHLCLETLLHNNGEFHWASRELSWWAHMGTRNRHRLLGDDMNEYHARQLLKIQKKIPKDSEPAQKEKELQKDEESGLYI